LQSHAAGRTLRIALWATIAAAALSRFLWLAADFPNNSPWIIDPAKFTDEGWWANAAVMHALTGHWHVAGGYNPAVALPVWPALLAVLFHFTGVSMVAARALSVVFSLATLHVVYALVRRHAQSHIAAQAAVLLLAASPFAFVFSRLAILDTLVIFEFCLALLVASHASKGRVWPLAALALVVTTGLLTKTTFAMLLPAIAWIAFRASAETSPSRRRWRAIAGALMAALISAALVPLALLRLWSLLVAWLGYGPDYRYFYDVNAMPDIDWPATLHWLGDLARNGLWVDRVLYPAALVILIASVAFARRPRTPRKKSGSRVPGLWSNPLFTASWLAIAGQAAFIFSRQDDYAPRYFLAMLAPVVLVVALALDRPLAHRPLSTDHRLPTTAFFAALIVAAVTLNAITIAGFLARRTYQLSGAAQDIASRVGADRTRNPLLFGVSAAQIGLMGRLPSINGAYGIDPMALKVARFKPGWYLAWNDETDDAGALRGHTLTPVASYRIFDDDERTVLTLYRIDWNS